jgi:tetratricopeptide (TPR) repeat protein
MGLFKEGIQQAKEASEIYERLGRHTEQARCLIDLAQLFRDDQQLDAAEEAASRAINLLSEKGEQFQVCHCHHVLGTIYRSKGEFKKAVHHLEVALGIASPFNWHNLLFAFEDSLADLFFDEGRFDDAHAHLEHAKSHATNDNDPLLLARAMWRQAEFWHRQHRFEEAKSEALRALDSFEKLGAADDVERVRKLLRQIDLMLNESDDDGELLVAALSVMFIDSSYSDRTR